jgi:hypothetical protein
MPDNIDVTPGTGKTVATDDVGGIQYQKVKLDVGGDGATAPLSPTDTLPATLYSGGTEIDFTTPVEVLGTGAAGTPATGVVTVQGVASMTPVQVSQATAASLNAQVVGNAAANASDSGNPVKVGGRYTTSYTNLTNNQRGDLSLWANGLLKIGIADPQNGAGSAFAAMGAPSDDISFTGQTLLFTASPQMLFDGSNYDRGRSIAGSFGSATGVQAVEQAGASKTNITTATTTQVKSGAGILHKVIVNTAVSAATISIYDATSGTTNPIGVITCPVTAAPFQMEYNCDIATGIRVVTSGATDVTVVWR